MWDLALGSPGERGFASPCALGAAASPLCACYTQDKPSHGPSPSSASLPCLWHFILEELSRYAIGLIISFQLGILS